MKRKTNSQNSKTPAKVLSTKRSILKREVAMDLRVHGNSEIIGYYFNSPAEKYRISLLRSLKQEHAISISDFLNEYQKILDSPKIPLLNMESAMFIYQCWKKHPQFIDNLICLARKIRLTKDSVEFWNRIVLCCTRNNINNAFHIQILSVLFSKLEWNEKSVPYISNLIYLVCQLPPISPSSNLEYSNVHNRKVYAQMYEWIDFILNQCPELNNDEKIIAIMKLFGKFYFYLEGKYVITKNDRAQPFMNMLQSKSFLNMLKSKFSTQLIFDTPAATLDLTYFCYHQNPDFFSNQLFFIKEYSDFEGCDKEDMIIMSFFRKFHFPTILFSHRDDLWLSHVLKGNNLYTYSNLPFKLTKKASHIFTHMFRGFLSSIEMMQIKQLHRIGSNKYLLYAQLRANQVSHEVALELLRKGTADSLQNLEFWISTITLLYMKGIEAKDVSTIFDYIDYHVIQRKIELNLKGKTISNLMAEVYKWHDKLAEEKTILKYGKIKFKRAKIKEFKIKKSEQKFKIKQLLNGYELFLEGKRLHHCVLSYLDHCRKNRCTIFSLRTLGEEKEEKRLLTIEVRDNVIYQIRGSYNRIYKSEEYEIVKLWAAAEKLKLVA